MIKTPYQNVMEKFIKKIKQDVKFFMYNGLNEQEIEKIKLGMKKPLFNPEKEIKVAMKKENNPI